MNGYPGRIVADPAEVIRRAPARLATRCAVLASLLLDADDVRTVVDAAGP
ncbi:MAG: hypothetical protein WB812_06350 [Woeseiaceae bacterium]